MSFSRLLNEPVLIGAAVRAVLLAAVAFGANVSPEQLASLMLVVEAVLALVTRALVTPNQLAEARVALGGSPTVPIDGDRSSIDVAPAKKKGES